MADVLSRPLFRQHYQTGGGVSELFERGKGMGGAALERGMGMGGTAVEYLMKQGLSLEAAIEELKNNPRLIEALERGEALAGGAFERGKAMAGGALEGGRAAMERLHGVPPGGFGAGSVNVPPGGFGAGAGSVNVPPGGFGGTNLPVPVQRSGLPVPTSSDVGLPRSFDTDHIDSFRNKAGRLAKGLGRFAMNPYVAAASVALPLAYDALTDSPEELLGQLDTQTRAYVEYLMEQGVSIEEALKIASPSEEAPLERQAGGPVMPPQAMMPPPQAAPAGMEALIAQAPEILNQAEGAVSNRMEDVGREYVSNTLSAVDMAEDPEGLINALRGTDAPIEQRYDELAQIVGEQDAEATPPSVLALVQPAIMMTEQGAVDSGIGNLMQEFSSSAEMLTGEGEATPMGEGVGNLMMAGAQPGMEALPPEAMMGPPPGAMMPPQAMMPPPPGGMAYGGPVPRFAYGGPVQHFEWGGGVADRSLRSLGRGAQWGLGKIGQFARLNPYTAGITAAGAGLFGVYDAADDPKFRRVFGVGGLSDIEDITGNEYGALAETPRIDLSDPRYNVGPSAIAKSAAERLASSQAFGPRIAVDTPQVSLDEAPQATAATIKAPGTVGFEYDFNREYEDPENFKKNFADRLKLYEDVLGSDKDFTKSQMLFDIAGAGLNFAAGRGAGGENVATQSPAAQLAAAFSQVPKTMGERLALQRQEERGVKTAALAATEKEETARKEAVTKERIIEAELLASVKTGEFSARNLVNIEGSRFNQQANLANAESILTRNIAKLQSDTSLAATGYRAELESALGAVNHQYKIIEDAQGIEAGIKRQLMSLDTQVSTTSMTLQARRESEIFSNQMQNARQTRELVLKKEGMQERLDADSRQHEDLLEFRGLLKEQDQKQFDDRIELEHLFRTNTTYTKEDLIEQSRLDRALRIALGDAEYNKFQTQLEESTRQFDVQYGLESAMGFGTLDYKNMVLREESFRHLIENLQKGPFKSDAATKAERDRDIFADTVLWKSYAAGDLSSKDSAYVDAFITEMRTPQVNPQTGLSSTKILPRNAREAIRERVKRDLPIPIQNPRDVLWDDVREEDYFGLREEDKRDAISTIDSVTIPGRLRQLIR